MIIKSYLQYHLKSASVLYLNPSTVEQTIGHNEWSLKYSVTLRSGIGPDSADCHPLDSNVTIPVLSLEHCSKRTASNIVTDLKIHYDLSWDFICR
jgi:hypothetical protein